MKNAKKTNTTFIGITRNPSERLHKRNHDKLKFLKMNESEIRKFLESYDNKANVGTICLTESNLEVFPEIIRQLTQLTSLRIKQAALRKFQDEIIQLKNLKSLEINLTDDHILPEVIAKFKNLEVLSINGSPLKGLPDDIFYLPKLKTLNVKNAGLPDTVLKKIKMLRPDLRVGK